MPVGVTDFTKTLTWLVDTPSVTGDEAQICTLIATRLYPALGRDAVVRLGDSLIAGRRTGLPVLLLAGHLDTVPSQGQGPALVEGDRLHGLGSADMKAGLAVMIHLLEDPAVQTGPYDVIGIFYAGEEGPSSDNQLEDVLIKAPWMSQAEFAIVLEPSDGELQLGCNGVINAKVGFTGKSAHSARPWLGDNAVTKAGEWLSVMHHLDPVDTEVDGLVYREVISVTMAMGGIANNIIPPRFDLNVNYRFPPNRSLKEAEAHLAEVCSPADHFEIIDSAPAGPVRLDSPFVTRLAEISGASKAAKQGWTDVARFGAHGIAAVNYGPGESAEAHQVSESVALGDLETVFRTLRTVLGDEDLGEALSPQSPATTQRQVPSSAMPIRKPSQPLSRNRLYCSNSAAERIPESSCQSASELVACTAGQA
jgi:succinyl-diaminopimelate desuccinylase